MCVLRCLRLVAAGQQTMHVFLLAADPSDPDVEFDAMFAFNSSSVWVTLMFDTGPSSFSSPDLTGFSSEARLFVFRAGALPAPELAPPSSEGSFRIRMADPPHTVELSYEEPEIPNKQAILDGQCDDFVLESRRDTWEHVVDVPFFFVAFVAFCVFWQFWVNGYPVWDRVFSGEGLVDCTTFVCEPLYCVNAVPVERESSIVPDETAEGCPLWWDVRVRVCVFPSAPIADCCLCRQGIGAVDEIPDRSGGSYPQGSCPGDRALRHTARMLGGFCSFVLLEMCCLILR